MTDDIVFSTSVGYFMNPTNWKERMRITKNDNVGIGTTSPNVALDVIGSIEYTGTITDVSDEFMRKARTAIA